MLETIPLNAQQPLDVLFWVLSEVRANIFFPFPEFSLNHSSVYWEGFKGQCALGTEVKRPLLR